MLAVAKTGSFEGLENKIGHLVDAGSSAECPLNTDRLRNMFFFFVAFRCCVYNLSCGLRKRDLWYNDV